MVNCQIIQTGQVVEQAFGRLKGRFQVLTKNHITDMSPARDDALVCCALHIVCESWQCLYCARELAVPLLCARVGSASIVRESWQCLYCVRELAVPLLCARVGSASIVRESWQCLYCVRELAVPLLCARVGSASIVRESWQCLFWY